MPCAAVEAEASDCGAADGEVAKAGGLCGEVELRGTDGFGEHADAEVDVEYVGEVVGAVFRVGGAAAGACAQEGDDAEQGGESKFFCHCAWLRQGG